MREQGMRIMLVVNEFPPVKIAGTAMATQALARALIARGYAVHVVVTTRHPVLGVCSQQTEGMELSWLADRPFKGSGIVWRAWQVYRLVRDWQPDIVQGQAISCGLLAAIAGRLAGIPTLTYVQGQDVYQASGLQLRSEIRWACRWATRVAAVTRHLVDRLAEVGACSDALVLPHGFNLVEVAASRVEMRARWQVPETARVVLCVGRLELIKGQDVLLHAWPRVLSELPDAVLCLVGDGSEREALQALAGELEITDSLRFLGHQPSGEVAACMQAADLLVLPSRSEAFGIVLLEAMACCLPVVASRVGGVPEVLPKGSDAWMVPPEDREALALGIVQALHADRYPSRSNRKWAMTYEWRTYVGRFEDVYREMLA